MPLSSLIDGPCPGAGNPSFYGPSKFNGRGCFAGGDPLGGSYLRGAAGEHASGVARAGVRGDVSIPDHLGTPQLEFDLGNGAIQLNETLAFGEPLPQSAFLDLESGTPQGSGLPGLESAHFTGHQLDTDTGLHNMHLRMYSSELKRFLRPDPALDISMGTPQSWNLYGYVGNNPVNYIDPTGGQIVGYQDEIHEFPPLDINGLRPEIEDFSPPKIVDIFPWTKPLHDIANQMYYFIKRNPRALRAIAAGAVVVGMMWASTVPGIGEGMDVVACMTGSPLDCASLLGSIAINAVSLGAAPNAGAVSLGNDLRRGMGVGEGAFAEVLESAGRAAGPKFLVGADGVAVHRSQIEMVESITSAGAVWVKKTDVTGEVGNMYKMRSGTKNSFNIRVMAGQSNGGSLKGPRTVVTKNGGTQYVHWSGAPVTSNMSKNARRALGHIHGQIP